MKTISLFFLIFPFALLAQPQSYNWYFGNQYGLNFSTGTPSLLTDGNLVTIEGCATISDNTGNLLFYTNGGGRDPISAGQPAGTIWNKNHEVMYDMGFTEGGGFSAAQSSLIIPRPGSDSVYYLFTMEEAEFDIGGTVASQPEGRGLSFFEIDLRLNNGLGGVVNADQRLFVPAYEALSGTIHANGEDYWIITYDERNNNNRFVRLLVDTDDISPDDIEFVDVNPANALGGLIKISPNSRWIYCLGNFYPFDNQTGEILPSAVFIPETGNGSFSADSRYFYTWVEGSSLTRYDMEAVDIPSSEEVLFVDNQNLLKGQLQLASNGNIYFVTQPFLLESTELGEIQCPSSDTPEIIPERFSFESTGVFGFFLGLPNFTDHIFQREAADVTLLNPESLALCEGESLLLETRITGDTYLWSDGSSEPTLSIDSPGMYAVTITDNCGDTFIDNKEVDLLNPPTITFNALPDSLCIGQTYELGIQQPTDSAIIIWSTGEELPAISISETGIYGVTVTNVCSTSSDEATFTFIDCMEMEDCIITFPNIFSPNRDGANDIFTGFSNCAPTSFELRVYSRWGKEVFSTNDPDVQWLGDFQGKDSPSDVYVYLARYRFSDDQEFIEQKGQLTLVR